MQTADTDKYAKLIKHEEGIWRTDGATKTRESCQNSERLRVPINGQIIGNIIKDEHAYAEWLGAEQKAEESVAEGRRGFRKQVERWIGYN